ncbi:MAG: F0F1 ATP synthase subunit A, partial [Chitinophagia bacterium]|nr:F0F1 ATP synthase subunit A [Chitinophagia bacterium]
MAFLRLKSLLAAAFALSLPFIPMTALAQHEAGHAPEKQHGGGTAAHAEKEGFDANEVIFSHIMDAHEYHFLDITDANGQKHPIGIPLPVILYAEGKGFSVFMSSRFEHGHATYDG